MSLPARSWVYPTVAARGGRLTSTAPYFGHLLPDPSGARIGCRGRLESFKVATA